MKNIFCLALSLTGVLLVIKLLLQVIMLRLGMVATRADFAFLPVHTSFE